MQLKMNKSLNIFLVILLCVVLYVGLLFSFYSSKNFGDSNPHLGYAIPTGGGCGTYAVSADVSRPTGLDVAVPMSSRRSLSMSSPRMLGYGGYYTSQNVQYLGGTYNSQSPIAYMSSSQTMKSFGGGGNGGSVSMSGEQVKSSRPYVASASGVSVSMPSTSMYAYNTNRNGSSASDMVASMSGDIALASSQAYAGIGNTTVAGPLGMKGRRNLPGIGGEYLGWLSSELWGYGDGYGTFGGGSEGVTLEMLKELYIKATGDTDFSNQQDWEAFLAWFNSKQSDDTFGWYWVPISDAIPFVLLLCLVYAFVIYRKTRITKNAEAKK